MPAAVVSVGSRTDADRLALLQALASDLAHAATDGEVARLARATAQGVMGATSAAVLEPTADGFVPLAAEDGDTEPAARTPSPAAALTPAGHANASSEGVFVRDRAELAQRFPLFAARPRDLAWAALPGTCGSQRVVLAIAFGSEREFPPAERAFLGAVAGLCAQAVRRTRSIDAERVARRAAEQQAAWAAFQADVARELWLEPTLDGVLRRVARMAVPRLADFVLADLAEGGQLRRVAVTHVDAKEEERGWAAFGRSPADEPVNVTNEVARTGQAWFKPRMSPEDLQAALRDAGQERRILDLGIRSAMCLPVAGRGGCRAVLSFLRTGAEFTPDEHEQAKGVAILVGFALANVTLREELREAAAQRLEALRSFAHDVRGPLAVAMLRAHTLARQAGPDPLSWGALQRSLQRVASLTEQVMDAARDDAGVAPEAGPLDLATMAREVADGFAPLARDRDVAVELRTDAATAWADAAMTRRIAENLLSNAIKFSRPGGRIVVATAALPEGARLVVQDDGVGWSAADQARIFEAFARPNNAATGTGLGLFLARKSAHRQGGRLDGHSDGVGLGATFTLTLPAQATPAQVPPATA